MDEIIKETDVNKTEQNNQDTESVNSQDDTIDEFKKNSEEPTVNEVDDNNQETIGDTIEIQNTLINPKKLKKKRITLKIIISFFVIISFSLISVFLINFLPVKFTEKRIKNIGEITLESENLIIIAEESYDNLSDVQKERVNNINSLKDARSSFDRITKTIKVIDAIGEVKLNSTSKQLIKSARNAYASCSADEKKQINNYTVLIEAENEYSDLMIKDVENLIDSIGKVTLNNLNIMDKAEDAYKSLSDTQKAKVKNYNKLVEAKEEAKKLKEEKLQSLLSKFEVSYDEVTDATFYTPSVTPKYINSRCFILPYIVDTNYSYDLFRLKITYTGNDWVFFKKIIFSVDDKITVKYFDYYSITRKVCWGNVVEYIDIVADDYIELLKSIATSKKTIVRFVGDDYRHDFTISSSDKKAIQETIQAYEFMKSID